MVYRRGYRPRRQLKKRWYASATIGKSVPFIGGTGITIGSGRRPYQRRALGTFVRRQVLKQEETKEKIVRVGGTMKHGTIANLKLNDIAQGTANNERIGDSVFYCGFNLKFTVVPSVSNSHWRFYVIKHRESSPTTNALSFDSASPPIGASLLFRNSSVETDSYINTDNVSILCSKVLKIDPRYTGEVNVTRNFKLNCRIMKRFQFRSGKDVSGTWTPSQEGEFGNYYLVVVPFSNTSGAQVVGSSEVGNIAVSVEQIYKDA